ncbi:MAG: AAA family ATPase [Gammaproteobacteria bacterium]
MLRYKDVHITATIPDGTGTPKLEIRSGNKRLNKTLDDATPFSRIAPEAPIDWMYVLFAFTQRGDSRTESDRLQSVLISDEIREIIQTSRFGGQMRPVAMAPVRSKPLRTYNPISDIPLPEGDHVPMVLAKTFFSDKSEWGRLKAAIDDFGEDSGLFTSLEIKGLGRHESDPFQIRVRIEGPPSNLVDVGYGISQVLPILVDALLSKRGSMFLLQQPEVHLHPRAQAALGTFMLKLAREQSAQLIVETHSDYLLDRLRMEIRDNEKASPGDVGILFFERNGVEVNVHSIDISENGNLNNAPESYRKFFLEEERRFLGV